MNLEPTPLDAQAELVIREKVGVAMAAVVEEVKASAGRDEPLGQRAAP